jgi:hypothetical protein
MVMNNLSSDVPDFSDASVSEKSAAQVSEEKVLTYRGQTFNAKGDRIANKSKWYALSLRTKATILAIALGVAPTLAVGGIAYYLDAQILTQKATETHQDKANEAKFWLTCPFYGTQP